jgi:hypothetical protein
MEDKYGLDNLVKERLGEPSGEDYDLRLLALRSPGAFSKLREFQKWQTKQPKESGN